MWSSLENRSILKGSAPLLFVVWFPFSFGYQPLETHSFLIQILRPEFKPASPVQTNTLNDVSACICTALAGKRCSRGLALLGRSPAKKNARNMAYFQ